MKFEATYRDDGVEDFLTRLGRILWKCAPPLKSLSQTHLENWVESFSASGVKVLLPFTNPPQLLISFERGVGHVLVLMDLQLGSVSGLLTWADIEGFETLEDHPIVIRKQEEAQE